MAAMPAIYRHSANPPAMICAATAEAADNQFCVCFAPMVRIPLRRRLWIGGSWVGLLVAVVVISQAIGRLSDPSERTRARRRFRPPLWPPDNSR